MACQNVIIGLQHIGIPTENLGRTIRFYTCLGFAVILRTRNESTLENVAFLQLNNLVIEAYDCRTAPKKSGAVDHIALEVTDIDQAFERLAAADLDLPSDGIRSLPFWKRGIRYFTIVGPNCEKIEFCQIL